MSFVHPLADVAACSIGEGTNIWQFVVVLRGAQIGRDCNICAQTLIEGDVIVGDRVTVKSGVQLWDGTRIESDVFVGPNVTLTNDLYPRSKEYPDTFSGIMIRRNASIGANATILPGVTIGEYAMVGAGAVVTENVPARAVVVGNPAKVIRYVTE
jgi:UDP-2-acetamido-3-amino-2,3-dideoxy-glucuronate N-acetyltransferase